MTPRRQTEVMQTSYFPSLSDSFYAESLFPLDDILADLFADFLFSYSPGKAADLKGTDRVAVTRSGQYRIDFKIRSKDPKAYGKDDLAIELYSVVEKEIRGYENKATDYLLWLFEDSGRAVMIAFKEFKKRVDFGLSVFQEKLPVFRQKTVWRYGIEYHSEHCYVPMWYFSDIAIEYDPAKQSKAKAA